jgi:ATP-binding cassette subfamily C (CFTR/MRP) protein 1
MLYADSVIILNKDGKIDRQGTYHDLGLQNPHDESEKHANIDETILNNSEYEALESSIPSDSGKAPVKENDNSTKTARQTGDMSVYGYYFASMKWKVAVAFIIFQILFAFLASFPCTYPIRLFQATFFKTYFMQLSG